ASWPPPAEQSCGPSASTTSATPSERKWPPPAHHYGRSRNGSATATTAPPASTPTTPPTTHAPPTGPHKHSATARPTTTLTVRSDTGAFTDSATECSMLCHLRFNFTREGAD